MPRLDFDARRDGFHFENDFKNFIFTGPIEIVTLGRCGGMAATSLDYYRARIPVPAHIAKDMDGGVPFEGSRLGTYIYDRLLSTIARPEGLKFFTMPWITTADTFRWSVEDEFPKIRRQIDAGRIVIIGLWSSEGGNIGGGHQVVCYGYETNPMMLWIYDNNHDDQECNIVPVSPDNGIEVRDAAGIMLEQYRGFFFHDIFDWQGASEKPPYIDLAVASGITVVPNEGVDLGGRVECSFTVRNYGEYPSHLRELQIFARGPDGEILDPLFGGDGNNTPIQPGEERTIHRVCESFGNELGNHVLGAAYISHQGFWRALPPGHSRAVVQRQYAVERAEADLVLDKWIDIAEAEYELRTYILVEPGDEIAFDTEGHIWAGAWDTGQNGPGGLRNIDHNSKFPLNQGPDAHPFCLLGRYEGLDYFYIGDGLDRHSYDDASARQLILRINDDMPGNGTGAFRCRIRIWRV
jgi:hypothetical protein